MGHPGTPILYDPSKPVAQGGLGVPGPFSAPSITEKIYWPKGLGAGTPRSKTATRSLLTAMLSELGWTDELTDAEMAVIRKVAGVTESGYGERGRIRS